jgi:hypothetical protein
MEILNHRNRTQVTTVPHVPVFSLPIITVLLLSWVEKPATGEGGGNTVQLDPVPMSSVSSHTIKYIDHRRKGNTLSLHINFWIKGIVQSLLPPAKPKIFKCYANIRRCCKSHAAPFILLSHNISTNLNGATESLALCKGCYQNQK